VVNRQEGTARTQEILERPGDVLSDSGSRMRERKLDWGKSKKEVLIIFLKIFRTTFRLIGRGAESFVIIVV
jgi:hypothetical protein